MFSLLDLSNFANRMVPMNNRNVVWYPCFFPWIIFGKCFTLMEKKYCVLIFNSPTAPVQIETKMFFKSCHKWFYAWRKSGLKKNCLAFSRLTLYVLSSDLGLYQRSIKTRLWYFRFQKQLFFHRRSDKALSTQCLFRRKRVLPNLNKIQGS
jgi:hypothetical protein